jgi:hypothetical protein
VFGYFQSSFVDALKKWIADIDVLDEIAFMKSQRADFSIDQFDEILKYNIRECHMLVILVELLFKSFDKAGLRVSRYDGAGSIASALMSRHKVKEVISHAPPEVVQAAQIAYAGGRIEAIRVGNCTETIHKYDINSAYPSAIVRLPLLRDSVWQCEERVSDDTSCQASLVAVEWSFPEATFYPLFYRECNGQILFPQSGRGIFWRSEWDILSKYFRTRDYDTLYAWNAYSETTEYPLTWVADTYQQRLEFKREGNMAQEALKLGINSIYGKFAQQEGWLAGIEGERLQRLPSYHDLLWAGMITSATRSKMFELAMQKPNNAVAFATDAVFSLSELDCKISDQMGAYSYEQYDGMTIVQAGVYWLQKEGLWKSKYRGFDKGSLQREMVINAWSNGTDHLDVTLTRFVGMGSALSSGKRFAEKWRTWDTQPRKLDIIPQGKRRLGGVDYKSLATQFMMTEAEVNMNDEVMSTPYPLAWLDGPNAMKYLENGVDINLLENEYEESWL